MKTIFISGVNSFIGHVLATELVKKGHCVYGLSRYVSDRDYSKLLPGVRILQGDLSHYSDLQNLMASIEPEIVIHLGAQTSVNYSFSHEQEVMNTNFIGTWNLANIVRHSVTLDKFIFASSVETYGNQDHFPIEETQPLYPASPYGVAKVASEVYLRYLLEGFQFPSIVLRSTNTYGRKKCHNFVIEHIIYDILSGKKVVEMGDPSPIRDFLYVDDEVDVYLRLVESEDEALVGDTFNTGTSHGISIKELFDIINNKLGGEAEAKWKMREMRPYEIHNLTVSGERLEKAIGWKPRYNLDKGLDKVIGDWKTWFNLV